MMARTFGVWLALSVLACAGCGDAGGDFGQNTGDFAHPSLEGASVGKAASAFSGGITWPASQLLPTFPEPAPIQDLIILTGRSQQWEAEGTAIAHKTGRLETDGWLCQVGVDAANAYMVYGPYDTTVPAGGNTAQFRVSTDNNTANDDAVITVDVNDSTAGKILATQTITRKQFTVAGAYTTFSLPFTVPADNHALELRVYWTGAAYTKVDWVGVTRSQADDEMVLFSSLKGIVNAKQPRIFSYEGDAFAEGKYTWLKSLGLTWNEIANNWDLIAKYKSELAGIIVYDNSQPDTINLATTLAGDKKALVVSPSLAARLAGAPYNLPILLDLRGKYASKLAIYQALYDTYWPTLTHRVAFGLNPLSVRAAVREYATALGGAAMWLDPAVPDESALLNKFLASMGAGGVWMGWWTDEGAGVTAASNYGVATVASDYATNLTMHSGMPRTIHVKPMEPKPDLKNKIYVAFILSDGDNLQYVEHLLRKLWNDPGRGKVRMGWTLSPAMVDAMPGALDYLWTSSTPNDNLISGPSGYGYTYPNVWPNAAQLDQFVAKTEEYNERAGFRVTTVWNTITGGINAAAGASYAKNATSLLGMTAQNTGGGLTIYGNSLPGMALACNYCTGEQAMKDFIGYAAQGWNGNEPRFAIIQAQPWQGVTPTSFANVAGTLGTDYVVVRPDSIFQLIREKNGLSTNPIHTYTITPSADAHGSISPSTATAVKQNESQTFTFTPSAGYVVDTVSIDGTDVGASASYGFINVTADHTIHVTFADPNAPKDAGTHGGDASAGDGGTKDAGAGASDGGPPTQPPGDGDGGTGSEGGCNAAGGSGAAAPILMALALLAQRRRRRPRA